MKDRTALIVGAANDIGGAISVRFAKLGARVVLIDTDRQELDKVSALVAAAGGEAEVIAVDGADSGAVKSTIDGIAGKHGSIDILVNAIDHRDGVPITEGTVETWERSLKENITPLVSFSLNVIPVMKNNKYGRIVNIGSLDYLGTAKQANYSTAKSAIFGLTRSFALELAKDGITVNQILKGDVKTAECPLSPEEEEKGAAKLPVQRLGKPEDIAYAAAYFASGLSGYVTGQNLIVCGGKSIYSSMSA
ncbi:short-chain dehydrogenase/reductase SDR [Geobacter metallireducens RCH3]|uniref:2-[hydroxy(Phenyl)methyl]-succinyl-CoA dehydrogenase subunit n=1 Tax=Geobacter metallireducens (strain ATCC 53774 / DSM 7210 / GS-15) TaxID=269799 RepID=Q39VG0_GEOMG|nr:SDR family NAD(P)-dependent oxidoreductase [Geobacter metallireducens]ABB31764.1 2-[hydroxy(phenyl)methyl]-succinyl-CoA dehydrogenase subunit [Geobacter metallireducens GS-15]EHP89358.1 short-chain dehydrogenase/reductase SDR [Geobacter metallireducens RCH3]